MAVMEPPSPMTSNPTALRINRIGGAASAQLISRCALSGRLRSHKNYPEVVELPGVLRSNGDLSLRFIQQQDSRPRTVPSTPTDYTPPLLVRSLAAAPKGSRLHNPSVLRLPLRQRSASTCVRPGHFSFVGSPKHQQPSKNVPLSGEVICQCRARGRDSPINSTSLHATENFAATDGKASPDQENSEKSTNSWDSIARLASAFESPESESKKCDVVDSPPPPPNKQRMITASIGSPSSSKDMSELNSNDREQEIVDEDGKCSKEQPSCRRNLTKEMEKELTFRPELNQNSLKIASRSTRQNFPLMYRLTERRNVGDKSGRTFSFAPKINPHSVKLAQERANKINEVRARMAHQAAKVMAEVQSKYTFKPQVSEKSLRIAETLGTSFEKRQEIHMEKRKKAVEPTQPRVQMHRPKKSTEHTAPPTTNQEAALSTQNCSPKADRTTPPSSSPSTRDHSPIIISADINADISADISAGLEEAASDSPANLQIALITPCKKQLQESPSTQSKRVAAVLPNSQIKNFNRRRPSHAALTKQSSAKVKCRTFKRKSEQCPSKEKSLCFHDIHTDRDRAKYIRMAADQKIREKKIFLIHGGYRLVRKSLRRRGWVELDYIKNKAIQSTSTVTASRKGVGSKGSPRAKVKVADGVSGDCCDGGDDDDGDSDVDVDLGVSEDEYEDEEEYSMVCRTVRNSSPNFVWTLYREPALYDSLHKSAITNHYAKASSFTTKVDLSSNLRNLFWFDDTHPDTFYPRCYCLSSDEEREMFIEDYRFTAAVSILKIVSQRHASGHPMSSARSSTSSMTDQYQVPERAVHLALRAGEAYLGSRYHDDIESSNLHLCPRVRDQEWEDIVQYYCRINAGCHVIYDADLILIVNRMLNEIKEVSPQFNFEGHKNIWIVKPGAMSRGRGIVCLSQLEDILEVVSNHVGVARRPGKYVVQKYIERPLLIYETKFDIRQWFLVTDWNPLTMWMYKDSYLRFSSQPYSLESMDVSIHLCNNSIQRHYQNNRSRSEKLPPENMWDSDTFQDYLSSIGFADTWDKVIYPGMKKALVHALQVSQDEIEQRKSSFELYGADFMICQDYHPWLIEINSCPTMGSSTEVTTRLCRQVLEDTLKVVIDRKENKDCSVGRYELAYKQARVDAPPYVGMQLCVRGAGMKLRNSSSTKKPQYQCYPTEPLSIDPAIKPNPLAYGSCQNLLKIPATSSIILKLHV